MQKPFEEALADLLAEYSHHDLEEIVSAMEIHLSALRDDLRAREAEQP